MNTAIDTLIAAYRAAFAYSECQDPDVEIIAAAEAERDELVAAMRELVGLEGEIEAADHVYCEISTDCGTVRRAKDLLARYK